MVLKIRTGQVLAVSGTSAQFTSAMAVNQLYRLSANTDLWFLVGATGASATAGSSADSHFLAKGQVAYFGPHDATNGFVHCIQDSASGNASLSLVEGI
jgi:ABC-type uncharacterized transport system ATPase subunit